MKTYKSNWESKTYRQQISLEPKQSLNVNTKSINKQHNMFIHGHLYAVQNYVSAFGLESTAAYVLKVSGIDKDDLIRCQIETGFENERMLRIIESAFSL